MNRPKNERLNCLRHVKDMNTRKLKLSEKKYLTCVFNYRELDLRI